MAQRTTNCPNCGRTNEPAANFCAICGTPLKGKPRSVFQQTSNLKAPGRYDSSEGEDDLMVQGIWGTPATLGLVIFLCLLLSGALAYGAYQFIGSLDDGDSASGSNPTVASNDMFVTSTVAGGLSPAPPTAFPTNTRPAPPLFPTVTNLPPSDTPTATPGPCIETAGTGDSVYAMAIRCGHRDLGIVDLIVEQNLGLECAECLREGQVLEIPWPTPTPGGPAEGSGETNDQGTPVSALGTEDPLATLFVEPTLRSDLTWHTIQQDQNLIVVAQIYNTDAKVLSDLNPEIDFLQCDFGERYGGENCSVMFFIGQKVRVPAPTPIATIPPTPSGSETPTPTPTATFNVPNLYLPDDDSSFDKNSLITLRWTASGTLASNEVYLITMRNLDADRTFQDTTLELSFVVPSDWQPSGDKIQEFEWLISIATLEGNQVTSTRQQTTPRRFKWQGQ